ncbi:MAG: WGR domain-containing protein [Syntrophothermus sp.]|uniref:WGR domain-containing protein n=1 Tax=Syntrophothermus sp. TaxID=2736299 RepID=UPI00338E9DA3|nr:WGR domain-containing protein [Syntrophothermus sp.]
MEVYLENTTPPHNKFYILAVEPSLFYVTLRRHWGRIGKKGRVKVDLFDTWANAEKTFRKLYRRRVRHGYRPVRTNRTFLC